MNGQVSHLLLQIFYNDKDYKYRISASTQLFLTLPIYPLYPKRKKQKTNSEEKVNSVESDFFYISHKKIENKKKKKNRVEERGIQKG